MLIVTRMDPMMIMPMDVTSMMRTRICVENGIRINLKQKQCVAGALVITLNTVIALEIVVLLIYANQKGFIGIYINFDPIKQEI